MIARFMSFYKPGVTRDKQESLLITLLVPHGFDTLEYSRVKATSVSVRLQIYSVRLRTANNLSGAVAGER